MTDEAKTEVPVATPEPAKKGWKPGDGVKAAWEAVKENPGHAVVGAVVGQILIPIPGLGLAVGGAVGGWIGKKNNG